MRSVLILLAAALSGCASAPPPSTLCAGAAVIPYSAGADRTRVAGPALARDLDVHNAVWVCQCDPERAEEEALECL